MIKDIKFKKDAQKKIVSGVSILAEAVKSTLGPFGRIVLAESEHHVGHRVATKDGVTVAKLIEVDNGYEDLVIRTLKESANKTAQDSGDGTSTSIVLAEAILKETLSRTGAGHNMTEITRNINVLVDQIMNSLDDKSTPVTGEMLKHVATISANNDDELGEMIAAAYDKIGKDGYVAVKNSKDHKTTCEFSEGIKFDRGYSNAFQITNEKGNTSELKNPLILITDRKIESLMDIGDLMGMMISTKQPILLIAELGDDAASTFNMNIDKGAFKGANVHPPGFGHNREEMCKDLADATGAVFISDKLGSEWGLYGVKDMGTCDSVVIDRESTNIIGAPSEAAIEERVLNLKAQLDATKDNHEKEILKIRIANLCGKVATIYVGGTTPMEQKERKDRVDDAVPATKAALDEGVLAGGGIALLEQARMTIPNSSPNMVLAADVLSAAMCAPFDQILINGDLDPDVIMSNFSLGDNRGYNSKTGIYGDMFEMGVIDPAKVTKAALKNGSSAAITLLMTDTIIINMRAHPEVIKEETVVSEPKETETSWFWGAFTRKTKG